MKKLRLTAIFCVVLLLTAALSACGSKSAADCFNGYSKDASYEEEWYAADASYDEEWYAEAPSYDGYGGNDAVSYETAAAGTTAADGSLYTAGGTRKEIRYAYLSVRTENYDESYDRICGLISSCGGYVERQRSYGSIDSGDPRCCEMTVRIPAERLDEFLASRGTLGTVDEYNVWSEDVTDSYTDIETRLESLYAQKDRLLALMEQAENMEDLITLENALTDTLYQIESYSSDKQHLDGSIRYSTVTLTLQETFYAGAVSGVHSTLGERISLRFGETVAGLKEFGGNAIVFLAGSSPVILIWAAVIAGAWLLIRRAVKKHSRKASKPLPPRAVPTEKTNG